MPYDPGVKYDASPLYKGLSDAGAGFAQMFANAEKQKDENQFYDQQLSDLAKFEAPGGGGALVDPESLDKLLSGNLNAKKAAVADAVYKVQLGVKGGAAELPSAMEVGGKKFVYTPKTGQLLPLESNAPPEPGTPWTEHRDETGKVVAKSRWNPYTHKTETLNMRPAPSNPLDALVNPGGTPPPPQQPAGTGANLPVPTTAAPASGGAAIRKVTTREQFDALPSGAVYVGRDGRTYKKP